MFQQNLKGFSAKCFAAVESVTVPESKRRVVLREVQRAEPDFRFLPTEYCSIDFDVKAATNRFVENARGILFTKVKSLFTNSQHLPDTAYMQAELVSMVDPIVEFTEFFEKLPNKTSFSYMETFKKKHIDISQDPRKQQALYGSSSPSPE